MTWMKRFGTNISDMNKNDARKIAETITNEQIHQMFENARLKITDWTRVSSVNKGMTKGTSWNILAKSFDIKINYHILAKINMVREFGEFLPDQLKPKKVNKQLFNKPPVHQEPELNIKLKLKNTMDLNQKSSADHIIEHLLAIDIDGETMEYIINGVGLENQMLHQLVMKSIDYNLNHILKLRDEIKKH